jgi:predicted PurR-regulated permease PerM
MDNFNERLRQIFLLVLLILLSYLCIVELTLFLPGLLGAVTLYILSRESYFRLVFMRKWKKGWTALMYIIYYLLILGIPIYLAVILISPKINSFLSDPAAVMTKINTAVMAIQDKIGFTLVSDESIKNFVAKITAYIPTVLNSTATIISNLAIMLFILYYMLFNGKEIERYINRTIPLDQANINLLASETKRTIKANALGIPLISIIQGLAATLGYFLFGVEEWALWGFLTGIFAFFPVVGTMVVWVPLVLFMYASGDSWHATWILIYSVVVTGNIDYVARITLLKRMGDVHPVITILGVIIGLGLFGFIGLVFGPLLLNYIVVLFEIYDNEFNRKAGEPLVEADS